MRSPTRISLAIALLAASAAGAQTTVVPSGVSELAPGRWFAGGPPRVEDPVLHYYTVPQCNVAGVPNETSPAKIVRAATYPAATRDVFVSNPARAAGVCNPFRLLSNIEADATRLFWFDNEILLGTRLASLPRAANPGDAPSPLAAFPSALPGSQPNEIVAYGASLFVLVHTFSDDSISQFDKDGNALAFIISRPANSMSNLQFDGRWVWWLEGTTLRRFDTQTSAPQTIDTGVWSFHSEGDQSQCSPLGCTNQNSVYIAKGNQLLFIDSFALGTPPFVIYTAPANRPGAFVRAITRSQDAIFFLEVFPSLFSVENRLFRASFVTPELIHGPIARLASFQNLQTDNQNLIWHDPFPPLPATTGQISSIKNNAPQAFLLRATGLEVTQGIQNLAQDVRLIENKRTFVRFYVTSDDSRTVAGVGATLTGATQTAGALGTLEPVDHVGKLINVVPGAPRSSLQRSFQFELPLRWTLNGPLTLLATLNPNAKVFENDTTNNTASAGPLAFSPSPRTDVYYMNVQYTLDGVTYTPAPADIAASQRHMRKLYPHGAPQIDAQLAFGNALHFHSGTIVFAGLEDHVKRTHPDCVKRYPKVEDREMCASDVVHAYIARERGEKGFIPANWRTFANIPQAPSPPGASYFTRGSGGGFASTGPSGPGDDITFANYAAHEVGHMLGRGHPITGTECKHDPFDLAFPYPNARIGAAASPSKELAFFEPNDDYSAFQYFDFSSARDTMGYCKPNRISDYTFEYTYQFALNNALAGASSSGGGAAGPSANPIAGDWLVVSGMLDPDAGAGADIVLARRVPQVADATPPAPSGLATLELHDAGGQVLASYGLPAIPIDDVPGRSLFSLTVPFEPSASELRIVDDATSALLATRDISANAPLVATVDLPGAPDPVDGVVAVTWLANDADGDALEYDVLASVDGGVSFRTVVAGIVAPNYALDSTLLAGGSTILRIEASDGVQTGFADSAPFVVAPRAPQVAILSPTDGHQASWNQLVTFEGEASDLQDAAIPDTSFVWSNAYGVIGTGRTLQTDALQVGVNTVTLSVTNSFGFPSSAAVDVIIGDVLADPAPSLASTPQSLAWHVAESETSPQLATLLIENAGGGALAFDIASDQPWLTIDGASAHSGVTAPASFAIAADTANAPQGLTLDALITAQNTANPFDTLVIPAALSKGNVFDQVVLSDADGDLVPDSADNCPAVANAGQEDADADAIGDACDNCAVLANAGQSDVGGVGASSASDGIGDACQCGDVNDDGFVTGIDGTLVKRASLGLAPFPGGVGDLAAPIKCDVNGGTSGDATYHCSGIDGTLIQRASLGLAPGTQQLCPAADGS